MIVTPDQVRHLWNTGLHIDRGDDLPPVTSDDLAALLAGDVDTDEHGTPADAMWEVLADHLNDTAGLLDDPQQRVLDHLRESAAARDKARALAARALADADDDLRAAVASCLDAHIPAPTVAAALGVTRSRVYQIRDGRR